MQLIVWLCLLLWHQNLRILLSVRKIMLIEYQWHSIGRGKKAKDPLKEKHGKVVKTQNTFPLSSPYMRHGLGRCWWQETWSQVLVNQGTQWMLTLVKYVTSLSFGKLWGLRIQSIGTGVREPVKIQVLSLTNGVTLYKCHSFLSLNFLNPLPANKQTKSYLP